MVMRLLRHLLMPLWLLRLRYPHSVLSQIERRIAQFEGAHGGELRFVVEHALEPGDLLAGLSARERALELFGLLRVWDTEHNNGVLIYVLHAEHAVEIITDRGLARCVTQDEWEAVCRTAETQFRAGRHAAGALAAIEGAAQLLARHFPSRSAGRNELPDQPLLL
jgi:uncharacterized membrane protein